MAFKLPGRKNIGYPAWGSEGSGVTGGGASPGSTAPQAGGESPTGWVNVQDYLSANKSQADLMGQGVAQKLEKEAIPAAAAADQYRADANTYMNTPTTTSPGYMEWEKSRQEFMARPDFNERWMQEWFRVNPKPEAKPVDAGPGPQIPSAPGEMLGKLKSAATPGGLATQFADRAGPSYNAGQANLDSYLAGAGGGGQAIRGLEQKYGNVLDLVRYPYPGAPPPGNRPAGPGGIEGTGGTVPVPDGKPPPTVDSPTVSAGPRPGGVSGAWQPSIGKRKRVV